MTMQEIIAKKKFGQELSREEISFFTQGAAKRTIPDYQLSAMLMVRYGTCSVLLTADVEPSSEKILTGMYNLKADILKYPHHGKNTMEDGFLEAVDPEIAIITNKKVEDWKGIKYLKKKQIPYYYTNVYVKKVPQYLHLMTDGRHWVLERVGQGAVVSGQ